MLLLQVIITQFIWMKSMQKTTRFGERIVQRMLVAGLISSVIGTQFPGTGTIYLSQNLKFLKPVKINSKVSAKVEIIGIDVAKKRLILSTICIDEMGDLVVTGEAVVLPPKY